MVPGQTATYTLSLAPSGGLGGSVTLTCSGAPAMADVQYLASYGDFERDDGYDGDGHGDDDGGCAGVLTGRQGRVSKDWQASDGASSVDGDRAGAVQPL